MHFFSGYLGTVSQKLELDALIDFFSGQTHPGLLHGKTAYPVHPQKISFIFELSQGEFEMTYWLVVWSIFYFHIYWECHHPN